MNQTTTDKLKELANKYNRSPKQTITIKELMDESDELIRFWQTDREKNEWHAISYTLRKLFNL